MGDNPEDGGGVTASDQMLPPLGELPAKPGEGASPPGEVAAVSLRPPTGGPLRLAFGDPPPPAGEELEAATLDPPPGMWFR